MTLSLSLCLFQVLQAKPVQRVNLVMTVHKAVVVKRVATVVKAKPAHKVPMVLKVKLARLAIPQ
jgi:hypothetical protein